MIETGRAAEGHDPLQRRKVLHVQQDLRELFGVVDEADACTGIAEDVGDL